MLKPLTAIMPMLVLLMPLASEAACTGSCSENQSGNEVTVIFSGNGTFVPPSGITSITVEAWGGGGGGSGNSGFNGGGGGGGGAYASRTFTVTPGNTYTVTVGKGGGVGNNGGSSSFIADIPANNVVAAGGGSSGNSTNGDTGGQAGASLGAVTRSGGNGGDGTTTGSLFGRNGGGGGGSATASANGGNGTSGGAGGNGEGVGGDGGDFGDNGDDGGIPGGGGGGRGGTFFGTTTSGAGADGRVLVSYTIPSAPLTVGSCEDFESGLGNWTINSSGGEAGTSSATSSPTSPTQSLYTRGGVVTVTSDAIDTSSVDTLVIEMWIRRGADSFSEDPDNNEDLVVEYFDSSNNWVALETFDGNGAPGEIFTRAYAPGSAAHHASFRIRVRQSGGNSGNFDYWHTDEVCFSESLQAAYTMDQPAWNGTADEVIDSSGNNRHGTAVNGADTDMVNPAVAGSPGTCGYATFDGSDDYVQINNLSDVLNGTASLAFWVNTTQTGSNTGWQAPGVAGVEESGGADDIFWGWLDAAGRIGISVGNDYDSDQKSTTAINDGDWHHVVLTRDAATGDTMIYIDGVLNQSGNTGSGVIGNSYASIGRIEDTGGSPEYFNGELDEIRIYGHILNTAEVNTIRNITRPCASLLNKFVISHDGYGINCLAETITVSARDAANNVLTTYGGTLSLNTQSGTGSWSLAAGNGAFSDPAANDGAAGYTFSGTDNGVATFNLAYPEGTTPINILVTDGVVTDDDSEGLLDFSPSGFTVTANPLPNPPPNSINDPVQNQTAGTDFPLHITAYGQTETDPQCGVIESYTGSKNLKFWQEYNDPVTGIIVPTIDGNAIAAAEGSATAVPVVFSNGQAQVNAKYKDVGRIRINMKDDTVVEPATGIRGATNLFIVAPANFELAAIERTADSFANPAATDENGQVFIAAGEPFSVTVSALDAEGDVTPNYGGESTPEDVRLDTTLVSPAGENNPALDFTDGFGSFSGGQATGTDFSWGEVGIITLTPGVGDGDYLGAGDVTGTVSGNIGRFTPHDFEVVLDNSPEFTPGCSGTFTSLDQPFDYATAPEVTITARNAAGATTVNYDGVWWKLADVIEAHTHDGTLPGTLPEPDDTLAGHTPIDCSADDCDGEFTLVFHGPLTYTRAGDAVAPFPGSIDITFPVTDDDGVAYSGNPYIIDAIGFTGGNDEQRWGRLRLVNVSGSELLDLSMPVASEYFDGTAYVPNTDDSCTSLSLVNDIELSNPETGSGQTGDTTMTIGGGTSAITSGDPVSLNSGLTGLNFSAAGENNTGYIDVIADLDGAAMSYLLDDRNEDGNHDANDNPGARVTFGIYSGRREMIYLREPW